MIEWVSGLPTWATIRVLGLASYTLIAIGIILGITYSFPIWSSRTRATLYKLHMYGTNFGTLAGLLHGIITVIDHYMPFTWREVLVPFAAENNPVLNGLGTLAGYGTLIVILATDLRNKLGKKLWRMTHLLSYPIFAAAFVHGYFLGTDTAKPAAGLLYICSVMIILSLTALRILTAAASKSNVPVQRRTAENRRDW